jgi:hypothetical protein
MATPQQTPKIRGNSGYDGWYFVITGTNEAWEAYIKTKRKYGTGHWIETHRYGGEGGMYRIRNCMLDIQCAAFKISAVTGMRIKDEIDYDNLWTYDTVPPKMKVTLSFPEDKLHENDIVLEGFCHTFIPRPQKKKELERKYGKPCR